MQFDIAKSAESKVAQSLLEQRLHTEKDKQDKIINAVASMHIRDRLVPPRKMLFSCDEQGRPKLHYSTDGTDSALIHSHALGQMSGVAGIPRAYVNRLVNGDEWERKLFCHNMTVLFHEGTYLDRQKKPTKYLHRLVGEELRGFLSRSFNRHLASLPLLRAFVEACKESGAQALDGLATPIRFSLRMFLPYTFEPVPGTFVAFGETWSNSDFGAGRMKVSMSCLNIMAGTMSILEDSMSKVHIGSIIQESDIEISDQTAIKEVEAQCGAIRDVVNGQLRPEPVSKMLAVIEAAHEQKVSWRQLKSELGRLLHVNEIADVRKMLDNDEIEDLPPIGRDETGNRVPTRWWASTVVGRIANQEFDQDRKEDLRRLAGDLLLKAS